MLYIQCKATRYHNSVDLVDDCGKVVVRVYDGNSRLHAFQAVKFWREAGLDGYTDSCAVSTSGGGGVKVSMWERKHMAALSGGEV